MATVEVQSLLHAVTPAEALDDLIELARAMKLNANSWRIGTPERFWLLALARVYSVDSQQIALMTAMAHNPTSWGNALTKLSSSRFANVRDPGTKTQGTATLRYKFDVDPVPLPDPITVTAGAWVFAYAEDPSITYRNITGGSLVYDGTLEITIEAESAGEAHDVPIDTITTIVTARAGVSVSNPANPTDWITRRGENRESDDSLQARNIERWEGLQGDPSIAYKVWAIASTDGGGDPSGITRVFVDPEEARTGVFVVHIAGEDGTATAGQVADVQAYIDARKSITARPTVAAAGTIPVNVTGSVYIRAGHTATAIANIEAALTAYINALDIGGTTLGGAGRVVFAEIIAVIMNVENVLSISLTSPTADVPLTASQIAVLGTFALSAVEV